MEIIKFVTHFKLCAKRQHFHLCCLCIKRKPRDCLLSPLMELKFAQAMQSIPWCRYTNPLALLRHLKVYSKEFLLWVKNGFPVVETDAGFGAFHFDVASLHAGTLDVVALGDRYFNTAEVRPLLPENPEPRRRLGFSGTTLTEQYGDSNN